MTDGFAAYAEEHQARFLMEYLLSQWFPGKSGLDPMCPELEGNEVLALKDRLLDCVPKDSPITALYEWDVRFYDWFVEEWFFAAVAGPVSDIPALAKELAEYFLEQEDTLELAESLLDDSRTLEQRQSKALACSRSFLIQWRRRIFDQFSKTPVTPLVIEG